MLDAPIERKSEWSTPKLFSFRWAFLFLSLVVIPELLWLFLKDTPLPGHYGEIWRSVVPWTARHLLGVNQQFRAFGSGDTGYANVTLLLQALLALLGSLIWTLASRRAANHEKLYYWLHTVVCFTLANLLLAYGVYKLFHVQFPSPPLTTLVQPFGQLTPHGLLWSFMGFSREYQIFAGITECAAATLLFWNRTATLGGLLSLGALVNVLALDWSYGVNVKLIVVRMLLLTVFVLSRDVLRLSKVLLLNAAVANTLVTEPFQSDRSRRASYAIKALVAIWIVGSHMLQAGRLHPGVANPGHPPLYGVHVVQHQLGDGKEIPAGDRTRWTLMVFDNVAQNFSIVAVRRADETWLGYRAQYDEKNSRVTLRPETGNAHPASLAYRRTQEKEVVLEGELEERRVEVHLRELPRPSFPLEDKERLRWIRRW